MILAQANASSGLHANMFTVIRHYDYTTYPNIGCYTYARLITIYQIVKEHFQEGYSWILLKNFFNVGFKILNPYNWAENILPLQFLSTSL
jgi:hypothetical protein